MGGSFEPRVLLILCGVLLLIFLFYCRMTQHFNTSLRGYLPTKGDDPEAKVENKLSYVLVVGVEGVGHRAVAPMIAKIGEACGHHIFYEHKGLRKIQQSRDSEAFQTIMQATKTAGNSSKNILVVEDIVFPGVGEIDRAGAAGAVKLHAKYDIEWLYNQVSSVGDMKMKILYLNRNFARAVLSHASYDGGFQPHANVMYTYIQHIQSEFELIHAKNATIWGQVYYEWFAELQDCPKLVATLTSFMGMGLQQCDVTAACERIHKHVHKEILRIVDPDEKKIADSFAPGITIPVLDYHP